MTPDEARTGEEAKAANAAEAPPGESATESPVTPSEHESEVRVTPESAPGSAGAPHGERVADTEPPPERPGGIERVLIFLNEVAGGRKLLRAARELSQAGATQFSVVAPQNRPTVGQVVDVDELRDAAQSRVDVTMSVLSEFGVESQGAVMDPDPALALDDAVRATRPDYILLSCLYETRFGLMRRDLVEWAMARFETPVEHIAVRVEDDAVRWDLTHTLVVATRTVNSRGLVERLKERAAERPHRYTFISPRSGDISRKEAASNLAATLAELYRSDIDATGQPLSPDPFHAIQNAIEHYRLDEILISTLRGQKSAWLEEGLIERVKGITDMPVEHVETDADAAPGREPEPAGVGAEGS